MKAVITGGYGFLGWHTACRLRALRGIEATRLGRSELADPDRLRSEVATADVVLHVAGVNRAETDDAVTKGNVELAEALGEAIVAARRPVRVVYSNSIQADLDNPYGRGKTEAARLLREATTSVVGFAGRRTPSQPLRRARTPSLQLVRGDLLRRRGAGRTSNRYGRQAGPAAPRAASQRGTHDSDGGNR